MKTSDFDYPLDKRLIAQTPIEPRDHCRLMVLDRADGSIEHRRFYDLPELLRFGDLLVFNDSRVFPARLFGTRLKTGAKVELTLLHRISPGVWRALIRPGRRMRQGEAFEVAGEDGAVRGEVLRVEPDGARTVGLPEEEHLDRLGAVPLPPYIHKPLEDTERYQTVYARVKGSVAAPTARLHFTRELLDRIRAQGVELAFVTLHVGWDSFRPVKTEEVESHSLDAEYYELGKGTADAVNRAKAEGRRVRSVGTTAVRLLEHTASSRAGSGVAVSASDGPLAAGSGWADIFILPGHSFRIVDSLLTNFHLPRSTLLMLTGAFAGRELLLRAYAEAAERGYRFYSFGDAMLIL